MIKILHTGDIHLGSLTGPEKNGINLRREDTLRCMDEIVQTAREERPDLTIIAGDLFNRSRVWADTALDDVRDAVERLLRPLCECSGHVVLLFGTANHDNPKAFENIFTVTNDLENLNVDTAPALYRLRCNDGSWVQIMSVPGFDKGRLRTFCPGMDKEAENFNATALINDTIMGLAGRCDKSIPTILTAHYTVAGAEADNGSTFLAGQDVVVLPATIDAAGVDLACLGHIHRPQKIACNTPAYYCGCINELTFNDEATRHGFYIHTMDGNGIVKSEFHELESSRKHYTMRIDRPQIMQFIADGTLNIAADQVYGKIVRVRYFCTSEEEKALNKAELQQKLMQMGAFYISDILPEDVEELDAKDQLTEHDGPTEALSRWLDLNNVEPWQKARLMELAAPIIAKADHGMDDGHSTGAFLPISIEVKNYRSYTDAAFSFEPVHMAMVNGANGVGKSSLFMDAIADCLYEQTRKEDIGGWVREGTKSGSIIFTFAMGEKKYRVVRTRTASGRGTLALQCFNAENQEWADGSDTTMRLTQTKIERLLGMDCNTFCSIALIRQDAYGLFLDADSDRRMEVLSALLGLDLYNRMAEITAAESKEQRRTIASAKDKYSYANDYEVVGKLKRFADDCGICLLLVHHTRKQQADDKFDMISGTNGLLGAADGAFLLQKEKRTDGSAILDVAGRDQQDQRMYLTKDKERLVWELERLETEPWVEPPDPVLEAVAALVTVDRPAWGGTATELAAALQTDMKPNALAMRLNVRAGRLAAEYHIRYENSRSHAGRSITLTLEPPQA